MGVGHKKGPGGGGASLNFDVKAYSSEALLMAATPKENTIGIITTTPITSWVFSATEPEVSSEGTIWILTGTGSPIEFNALKKNGLQVYPIYAMQYVKSKWTDKTIKIYQGGAWGDFVQYFFKSGEGAKVPFSHGEENNVTFSVDNTRVSGVSHKDGGGSWYYVTSNKVRLADADELVFRAKCTRAISGAGSWAPQFVVLSEKFSEIGSPDALGITIYASVYLTADSKTKEYVIPVTSLNSTYVIGYWGVGSVEIYDIFAR